MPARARRRWIWRATIAFALSAAVFGASWVEHRIAAAVLLSDLGGAPGPLVEALTDDVWVDSFAFDVGNADAVGDHVEQPTDVRARVYVPKRPIAAFFGSPRGIVLCAGVSYHGIDEPRLVAFARALAGAGVVVMTPEIRGVTEYRVDDPSNLATMRAAVRYLARRHDLVEAGGVTLMGVSFSGGLALRVASEPELRDSLRAVISLGGHNDMRRVVRFFVTDRIETVAGTIDWHAHDYGLAVMVARTPERFVAPDDVEPMRRTVRAFLHETYPRAAMESLAMSPAGRATYDRVFHRDTQAFSAQVLAALPSLDASMRAASPTGAIGSVTVPIFLLHGAHDDVVPPSETVWNAQEARAGKSPYVRALVSPMLGHAELGKGSALLETWRLLDFVARMIDP